VLDRRCAKCQVSTGARQDGTFVEYTIHPFVSFRGPNPRESIAVFCASCFDSLATSWARDRVASARTAPRVHVALA
jgi:hypothetical protein